MLCEKELNYVPPFFTCRFILSVSLLLYILSYTGRSGTIFEIKILPHVSDIARMFLGRRRPFIPAPSNQSWNRAGIAGPGPARPVLDSKIAGPGPARPGPSSILSIFGNKYILEKRLEKRSFRSKMEKTPENKTHLRNCNESMTFEYSVFGEINCKK